MSSTCGQCEERLTQATVAESTPCRRGGKPTDQSDDWQDRQDVPNADIKSRLHRE
jgi:hypothetical protein